MLPYRLRTPVFGNVSENRKRRSDGRQQQATTGGGPVQTAISQDLKALQQSFLEDLLQKEQQQQQQQQNETSVKSIVGCRQSHWSAGKAFGIFKQRFGSAKIALLHLLLPHPRCDREAYAQILYAACLEHLREAMKKNEPTQEDAATPSPTSTSMTADTSNTSLLLLKAGCTAIFALYTLYETNPLLRPEQLIVNPMDYLPMGLQSRGKNPRALYRRAFRQRVRIDREHFSLLLRLKELCRAQIDHCSQKLYAADASKATLRNDSSTLSATSCTCGVARDTILILERLSSCWDFCEYTGPVGLEAMAGHPDYPYSEVAVTAAAAAASRKVKQRKGPAAYPAVPSPAILADDGPADDESSSAVAVAQNPLPIMEESSSTTLAKLMKDYQQSIQSIHLGSTKTKLASELRKTLEPILPREGKVSWSEMIHELDNNAPSSNGNTSSLGGRLALQQRVERQQDSNTSPKNNSNPLEANGKNDPSVQIMLQGNDSTSSYRLELPEDVPAPLQSHLRNALEQLLQRDGPDFLEPPQQQSFEEANNEQDHLSFARSDDVSTLGVGGISVATSGQGRAALQSLLSTAAKTTSSPSVGRVIPPRVAAIPTSRKRQPDQSVENKRNMMARFLDLDPALSNRDSIEEEDSADDASNVSNLSVDPELDDDDDNDEASAATSAVGRRALDLLLAKVSKSSSKKGMTMKPPRKRKIPAPRKKKKQHLAAPELANQSDHHSVGSSVGPGGAALGALLQKVGGRQAAALLSDHQSVASSAGPRGAELGLDQELDDNNDENDEASAATSAAGRRALDLLLANVSEPSSSKKRTAMKPPPKRKLIPAPKKQKKQQPPPVPTRLTSDHHSVGSSVGPGGTALGALLEQAGGQSDEDVPRLSDHQSVGTSVGPGGAALGALLEQAGGQSDEEVPRLSDHQSVGSSVGPGGAALGALLDQAGGREVKTSTSRTRRQQRKSN